MSKREKEWNVYEERTFFSGVTPKNEVMAFREYFMGGDVDTFLQKCTPDFASLIYLSPVQTLSDLKKVIEVSFRWCLSNQENPEWIARNSFKGDWDSFLMSAFENCLSANSYYSDDYALWVELFDWIYGKVYEPGRVVELVSGETLSKFTLMIDACKLSTTMLRGFAGYLWYPRERTESERYKFVVDYFLSLYPNCDPFFFSKQLPSGSKIIFDSKVYRKGAFTRHRAFLASMNNILTPYDEEEGLTELVPSDLELLEKLREGLKPPAMPLEYYELEKFVIKQGYDCLYASE